MLTGHHEGHENHAVKNVLSRWPLLAVSAVIGWPVLLQYGAGWACFESAIFLFLALLSILGPSRWQMRRQVWAFLHHTMVTAVLVFSVLTLSEHKARDHWQHPWIAVAGVLIGAALFWAWRWPKNRRQWAAELASHVAPSPATK